MLFRSGGFGYANGLYNTSLTHERGLGAQYQDNQNYLSAFISGFHEQVGLSRAAGDQFKDILVDAVKGRYDGRKSGLTIKSPMFFAFKEAYPELGPQALLQTWSKIQEYVQAQREGYRNIQSKLLSRILAYDVWRESGLLRRVFVSAFLNIPSNRLEARIGGKVVRGAAALEQMRKIVLTQGAIDAYQDGTLAPLTPNGGTE